MIKTLARFVVRDSSDPNDGLLVGSLFRANGFFKPGRVYEVIEVLGEVTIRDVGETCIPRTMVDANDRPKSLGCWGNSIGDLLAICGKYLILTLEEFRNLRKEREQE